MIVKHKIDCWAFVFEEAERTGTLDVNKVKERTKFLFFNFFFKVQALGLPPSKYYKALKDGHDIELEDGKRTKKKSSENNFFQALLSNQLMLFQVQDPVEKLLLLVIQTTVLEKIKIFISQFFFSFFLD